MNESLFCSIFKMMQADTVQHEVRDLILDAAERLLVHYGYQKMTMQDLAQEAGIGVGTTYLHFKGKADVALGVVERANARVMERLRSIAASDLSPEERLREMLIARVLLRYEGARKNKHRLEEMVNAIRAAMRDGQRKWKWLEIEPAIFAEVLAEGERKGVFSFGAQFDSVDTVAATMMLAMRSMMPDLLCGTDFDEPEQFRQRVEWLTELLMRALRPDVSLVSE